MNGMPINGVPMMIQPGGIHNGHAPQFVHLNPGFLGHLEGEAVKHLVWCTHFFGGGQPRAA